MGWSFAFQDEKFDMGTLTLDDYVELEELIGIRWGLINPAASAKCSQIVPAYMYAKRTSTSYEDALAKAKSLNADAFAETIRYDTDELDEESPDPPKAGES